MRVAPVKRHPYHCEMHVSPRKSTRANQKERTRAALVEAARALLRAGTPPTVAEAAEQARVSRATAYRYFPTHDALLIEAGNITPATEPVEELVQSLPSDDPEERLRSVLDRFIPIIFAEEAAMRAALRTYQDTWLANRARGEQALPVREGRRMRWLDTVIAPLDDLPAERRERLRAGLALTLGADSVVVMKDACGLDDDEALEVLRWAATAILRAGLADPDGPDGASG